MSTKHSSEKLERFTRPLPIKVIQIPAVYPGNPVSWVVAACSFIYQAITLCNKKVDILYDEEECCFKVTNCKDANYLWESGFYGKGSLSRSEPTWIARAEKRILGVNAKEITGEEIVKYRRQLREAYKKDRNEFLLRERNYKLSGDKDKLAQLEIERTKLSERRDLISRARPPSSSFNQNNLRAEDRELMIDGHTVRNVEYLQLTHCESLFLSYIGAARVTAGKGDEVKVLSTIRLLKEQTLQFGNASPQNEFLIQFVVYMHYKSLGWCVKSGLKFSSDYVLYQRGPPFHHAAFAVTVMNNTSKQMLKNWTHFGSIFRVVSAVKKTMILCYVDSPSKEMFEQVWNSLDEGDSEGLIRLLNLYTIREIVYKRWTPSRTRV